MTSPTLSHIDEQHDDATEGRRGYDQEFPSGMLASPTRARL